MKQLVRSINAISKFVETIEEWLLYLIFIETILVGTAQVLARFVFHASLPWSEELLRMSFEWVTFFGASVGISRNTHVAVVFFVDLLPKALRNVTQVLGRLICIAFLSFSFDLDGSI